VPYRINLSAIEASLRGVEEAFERINAALQSHRDPMTDDVVENMVEGYAFIDKLVAERVEIFTLRNVPVLLEINNIVLCGTSPEKRSEFASHIRATEKRFYEERDGGIRDLMEWYESHDDESAWKRAAGTYVRILSKPQLFIEGNHRSGALVMSYILVSEGKPPFVLTVENAAAFFNPSSVIRDTAKKSPTAMYRFPGIKKRFAKFLSNQSDASYLLPSDSAQACA